MKKIFYLSLAIFMCLLYGCSPEGTDTIILPAPPEHIGSGNSNGGGNSSSSNDGSGIYDGISSSSGKGGGTSSSSRGTSSSSSRSVSSSSSRGISSSTSIRVSSSSNISGEVPSSVIPDAIREQIESGMPIYSGTEPPYIVGQYLVSSLELVKSSIPNDGIFVEKFADMYLAFFEHANGIDLSYQSQQGGINESQELIEVVGSGNNFTAYFKSGNISTIISGTLSQDGIIDFYYAFIMLDVNIYRIFKDGDDFAEKQTWLR